MMKSPHHSSIEKKELKDVPPPVTDASGSKTPVRQQSMPHQAKTPSSQKPMTAKQATPSLIRNRETGPYIRFEKPCYKPEAASATPFDRTSSEEEPQRKKDLPRFTYSQKPLVKFSSNAAEPPKDAPKGPRADQFKLKSATEQRGYMTSSNSSLPVARPDNSLGTLAAAIKPQTIPEIARKHLGGTRKRKVMELCLSLKDEYLAMNPAPLHDQEPFWAHLLEKLESNSVTQGKFKAWKEVKEAIEHWCQPRRTLLREGTLPPVPQAQPELDGLIDSWNEVFVQRFCKINRGYIESVIWSPLAKDEISGMAKTHVENWISDSLKKRRSELGRFARLTLLSSDSSTVDYHNATRDLQTQFEATKRDERQILDTKVVMSIITDLQPGLKRAISRRLNRNNSDNTARPRQEGGNDLNRSDIKTALNPADINRDTQTQGRDGTDLGNSERVSFRISPLTGDPKSTAQLLSEGRNSREQNGTSQPEASNGIPPRPSSRCGRDESTRKRKLSDPPSPNLATSNNCTIRDTIERASNTPPRNEVKRRRLDEVEHSFADSILPPATDFSVKRHDQYSPPRRQPSPPRRPGWNSTDGKKTRQGNPNDIPLRPRTPRRPASPEPSNFNKVPLKPRTPRRPVSPSRPRDEPYRQRPDYRAQRYARGYEPPEYLDSWRPGTDRNHERSRDWRENTVEFQRMPTERQNMSLRNQMKGMEKQLKALLEKDRR